MIKTIFTTFILVVLCSCTHVEDNQQAKSPSAKVIKKKALGEWETYHSYIGPADFLTIFGFGPKAYCAIAYKEAHANDEFDLEESPKMWDKQDLVLKKVIEDGVKLLRETKAFSTLSHDEAREKVYINLNSTMTNLGLYFSLMTDTSKDAKAKRADFYRNLYLNTDCELLIGYSLD